ALSTATYYVSQTSAQGCESARTQVSVTVNPTPAAPTVRSQTYCSADIPTVGSLPQCGGSYKWYTASTGGSALAGTTALTTGTYYVSQTSAQGCQSARTAVTVTVNTIGTASSRGRQNFCIADSPSVEYLPQGGGSYKCY